MKDVRGRGTQQNASGRFEAQRLEVDLSDYGYVDEEDRVLLRTKFFRDASKSIVTENDSPDIPFRYSMNFYRGCEHGCSYCYARPTHEYLGLSAGVDFESVIFVKDRAPDLLRERLMSPRWQPEAIMMSGVTDCYQPAERKFQLTRQCLQVLAEFRHPVSLITKNHLITRDVDVLSDLARDGLVRVFLSVTTLDADLARDLEPRTSSPRARLEAIRVLSEAGVPVGVNVAPVVPGLTEHELPEILKAAKEAGAKSAGYTLLRLPYSVKDIFVDWLTAKRPLQKEKVLGFLREARDGELNSSRFGERMRGHGPRAQAVRDLFHLFERRYGFNQEEIVLRTDKFRRPGDQLSLLD